MLLIRRRRIHLNWFHLVFFGILDIIKGQRLKIGPNFDQNFLTEKSVHINRNIFKGKIKIDLSTKNDAEQETEVDEGVLGIASPQGPKQVQVVHQLHDGASKSVETKTNHPRIENTNEGSTAIDDQCIFNSIR